MSNENKKDTYYPRFVRELGREPTEPEKSEIDKIDPQKNIGGYIDYIDGLKKAEALRETESDLRPGPGTH